MVNHDIVNYLREGIKRGFSVSLLRQKLLEGGFAEQDVTDAITFIHTSTKPSTPQKTVEPVRTTAPPQDNSKESKELKKLSDSSSPLQGTSKKKTKFIKLSAWCGVALIVISFIYSLLISFFPETIGSNIILLAGMGLVSLVLMILYLLGFRKVGLYADDRLLRVGSVLMIITVVLLPIASFLVASSLANIAAGSGGAGIAIASMGIITLLLIVSKALFSVGLIKAGSQIRFAKGAGFLGIVFTILFFIITVGLVISLSTLTSVLLEASLGGSLAEGLIGAGILLIVLALGMLLAFLVKLVTMILEIFTLFEASNKFEKQ